MSPRAVNRIIRKNLASWNGQPAPPAAPFGPAIRPRPAGEQRPFWSVMIPTYNRDELLKVALESVLAQAPGPEEMQIAVLDNCSTVGSPRDVIRDLGGAGRVEYIRHPEAIPGKENWNRCIHEARGRWVHILHDDDSVMPGYYAQLRKTVEAHPDARIAVSRFVWIDHNGLFLQLSPIERESPGYLEAWGLKMLLYQRFQCAATVVERSVYEALGGFRDEVTMCFDWDMWRRMAVYYPACYDPFAIACYRIHPASGTSVFIDRGVSFIADAAHAADVGREYVGDPRLSERMCGAAREFMALEELNNLNTLLVRFEFARALRLTRSSLNASSRPRVLARIASIVAKYPARLVKHAIRQRWPA